MVISDMRSTGSRLKITQNAELSALSRRYFLLGIGATALSGCVGAGHSSPKQSKDEVVLDEMLDKMMSDNVPAGHEYYPKIIYAAAMYNGHKLPPVNLRMLKSQFRRQSVVDPTGAAPGTIVVKPLECHLYMVEDNGRAVRYGIGIGRDGFDWSGKGVINHIKPWPTWTPPVEMRERLPALDAYKDGMSGGVTNPLGARALYIYRDGKDTLYRVHGTAEWWTIGRAMSSGCIRMVNQDVIDLASRVRPGSKILVG
jgi:lipoprotein-anchoring transpeptidase ErfK/SrfK